MKKFQAFVILISLSGPLYSQIPEFIFHKIGDYGDQMGQAALVDLDTDGNLDGDRDVDIVRSKTHVYLDNQLVKQ